MHVARIACSAGLLILGCSQPSALPAPTYPPLQRPAASAYVFTPASGLVRLSLPCATAEPDLDNGLDDDCDGRVDTQANTAAASLFISVAHASGTDLELLLTPASPGAKNAIAGDELVVAHRCEASAPFALQRAALSALESGRYELALAHGTRCGADLTVTASASVWLHGQAAGSFGVSVAPGARTAIGTLDVP